MSIRAALRQALRDFYFNSWRLAPANLLWGIVLIAALLIGPVSIVGGALIILLAAPTAGLYRMGALVARDEPASFGDFFGAIRQFGPGAIAVAVAVAALGLVLTTNLSVGLASDNPLGWLISAMALWGDVAIVLFLVVFWPVFVDPRRDGQSLRQKLALAGLGVIGRPIRVSALTLTVALVLMASTILFAMLVIVSVAYVAIVSSRVVLPMVDELEGRLPEARQAP
jgi:uncharacterized membrane protein YesL